MTTASGFLVALLACLTASLTAAQPPDHYLEGYGGPYRGRVIDADTKLPLAGAVVVAYWYRETVAPAPVHSTDVILTAREAVTDDDGRFVLDARDVEETAPRRTLRPYFIIFMPGYGNFPNQQRQFQQIPRRLFDGSGTQIELLRLQTRSERIDSIHVFPALLPRSLVPRLSALVNVERSRLGLK
jgi:hypothetical protein